MLNALRENKPPTYSPAEDVYAFRMVCYELRTGHIPFEGHRLTDYELALSGRRPELPNYLSSRMTPTIAQVLAYGSYPTAWMEQVQTNLRRRIWEKALWHFWKINYCWLPTRSLCVLRK